MIVKIYNKSVQCTLKMAHSFFNKQQGKESPPGQGWNDQNNYQPQGSLK